MTRIIAFVTYETPLFPCGGIAAVLGKLPAAMKSVTSSRTIVVSPRHVSDVKENKIPASGEIIGEATFRYMGAKETCQAWRLDGDVPIYFVGSDWIPPPPDITPLFAGKRHPYDVGEHTLLRDALIFGAMVAALLPIIGTDVVGTTDDTRTIDWRLVMQDWEAVTTALTVGETTADVRLYLVLHNSYDCFAPPTAATDADGKTVPSLNDVGITAVPPATQTILNRVLTRVREPVFTVSAQFAHELTSDQLQTAVMAPHLQRFLSAHPVLGVDNGPFTAVQVPADVLQDLTAGAWAALYRWKAESRIRALDALSAHQSTPERPIWGDRDKFASGHGPWLVMAGRDDPRQKGYDVAARAVDGYLEDHHHEDACPQFLFFPMPGDEGQDGLRFLRDLAERRAERVVVLPFRWTEGYMAALQASCFGLMPSLYEPFGMANEFYLGGGCVGIARATGGNVQQIVPLWASRSCSAAVRRRSMRFHAMSSAPTGLLYREPDDLPDPVGDWQAINRAAYIVGSTDWGRVQQRASYAVFDCMAVELRSAIEDGMRIWTQEPELYGRMVVDGIRHITETFSWLRAAREYASYVDSA